MLRHALLVIGLLWAGQAPAGVPALRQLVAGEQVAQAARAYLLRQLQPAYASVEVSVAAAPAELSLPAGELALRVRELRGLTLRPRMVLWVDVIAGGQSRPVPVALAVRAMQSVMVAARALAAGEQAGTADVEVQLRDVAALAGPAAAPLAPQQRARMRKAVAAGDVLLQSEMSSAAGVLRGDRVRLLAGANGMALESAALALSDGEPGQPVMVRPVHGEAAVLARVAGAGIVRLEE